MFSSVQNTYFIHPIFQLINKTPQLLDFAVYTVDVLASVSKALVHLLNVTIRNCWIFHRNKLEIYIYTSFNALNSVEICDATAVARLSTYSC